MPQHSTKHQSATAVLATCTLATAVSLAMLTTSAEAFDARSIALGGSSVAHGIGVGGAIENPASLAAMKRRGDTAHFQLGAAADARDHGNLLDTLLDDDNRDLADDLEAEINNVSGSTVTAECSGAALLTATDDTVCLSGTQQLAELANEAIVLLDDIEGEPISGLGEAQAGFAVTSTTLPFALHFTGRGTGFGVGNVDDGDREYVADFVSIMEDDDVTLGEVQNSARFGIENGVLDIEQPEDVIRSTGVGGAMMRLQFGVSLALSVEIADYSVDIGITPKFSQLTAFGVQAELNDAFNDASVPFEDQFEDSEVQETSFTFDVGASTQLPALPLRLSAVLRNVVPESIETTTDIEFETTPQLIVGALHQRERLSLMASVAINTAELDGLDTHPVALGVEYGTGLLAVRGGLSADLGRDDDTVALSAGVKLGPLEVGGRLSAINQGQIGAQLSFGF